MGVERTDRVEVEDGSFDAWVALPEGGSGPGVLLLHEIFGIAEFAKTKASGLASSRYVVVVPDVFWRLVPGFLAPDSDIGVQQGMATASLRSTFAFSVALEADPDPLVSFYGSGTPSRTRSTPCSRTRTPRRRAGP